MNGSPQLGEREVAYLLEVVDLARRGESDELEAQLDAGISANLTNDVGDTLLILAAYHAHPDTVEAILRHGADHSRVNNRGQTALGAAVFRRDSRIVSSLLAAGADPEVGAPSAVDVARFFELAEMMQLLGSGDLAGENPPEAIAAQNERLSRPGGQPPSRMTHAPTVSNEPDQSIDPDQDQDQDHKVSVEQARKNRENELPA